jgi:hypothetical protein
MHPLVALAFQLAAVALLAWLASRVRLRLLSEQHGAPRLDLVWMSALRRVDA